MKRFCLSRTSLDPLASELLERPELSNRFCNQHQPEDPENSPKAPRGPQRPQRAPKGPKVFSSDENIFRNLKCSSFTDIYAHENILFQTSALEETLDKMKRRQLQIPSVLSSPLRPCPHGPGLLLQPRSSSVQQVCVILLRPPGPP